jgi:preprotein translocase subunit SecE
MITKIKLFFVGSYEEFLRVIWPSRQEVTSHTIIVVCSMLVAMGLIAALDYGLFNLVQILVTR